MNIQLHTWLNEHLPIHAHHFARNNEDVLVEGGIGLFNLLCDPDCPGSADVLAEIARRREAAAKPKTQEAQ